MVSSGVSGLLDMGEGRFAHATGALWFATEATVLIADAHLGYGWALRRRGGLGPVADLKSEPRLLSLLEELRPARVVFLGDLVHAPKPGAEEREAIESTLKRLAERAELLLVRGNHDRAFLRDFGHLGVPVVDSWQSGGLAAIHGDGLGRRAIPEGHLVLGHLHPTLRIRDSAGAGQRLPVLLTNERATLLPAFSSYSGGFDIARGLPSELKALFGRAPVEAIAVTGKRALSLGRVAELPTNLAAEVSPGRRRRGKQGGEKPAIR